MASKCQSKPMRNISNLLFQLTGLTKRTTCDDVIYALLSHDSLHAGLDLTAYAIHERWRGVERPLSGRTKIMKVWRTWGSEARNVKLYLRKVENILDTSSEVSHTRRPRKRTTRDPKSQIGLPKDSRKSDFSNSKSSRQRHEAPHGYTHESAKTHVRSASAQSRRHKGLSDNMDRHRESGSGSDSKQHLWKARSCDPVSQDMMVPAAKSGQCSDPYGAKAFHDLVHVILDQERSLQKQKDIISDTDNQIHMFEYQAKKHEKNRKKGELAKASSNGLFPNIKAQDMEAYLHICDSILELQDKISQEQHQIDSLSVSLSEEPNAVYNLADDAKLNEKEAGNTLHDEVNTIRSDIERSMNLSLAQQKQLQLVSETLGDCERQLRRKRQYLETLAAYIGQDSFLDSERGQMHGQQVGFESVNHTQGHHYTGENISANKKVSFENKLQTDHHILYSSDQADTMADNQQTDSCAAISARHRTVINGVEPNAVSPEEESGFLSLDLSSETTNHGSSCSNEPMLSDQNKVWISDVQDLQQFDQEPLTNMYRDYTTTNPDDNQTVLPETNIPQETAYDVECDNIEVISDDSAKPRSILKSRPPGYSVRFADEVGSGDYVNYDPCLTQVYEYSKYENHDYANIDELDQGYVDYVNDPYEYDNEDNEWEEPVCKVKTSVTQNVDTGEVYVDTSCEVDAGMVPYYTYHTYSGDCEGGSGKMNSSDDSNSDTGLSSMHSDDPVAPVLETLV